MDILILMGGPSLEHDVSIVSGSGMVKHISPNYDNVYPVYIDRDGLWTWSDQSLDAQQRLEFDLDAFLESASHPAQPLPSKSELPGNPGQRFALLGLHGAFGEDGRIQAYLELLQIPYSGSGVLGSALAMDKIKTKEIYRHHNIPTAPWVVIRTQNFKEDLIVAESQFTYPMILKDPAGGSSYNIIRAENHQEAIQFLDRVSLEIDEVLAEKCIVGKESSCGFVEGADRLPPTEIRPLNETAFFDFEAKYQGKSQEITPAEYSPEWIREIQDLSRLSHEVLKLNGYSRTDFITDDEGVHWALETNTLPGFTPTSLLPQQAATIGWDYSQLIHEIIQRGLQR